MNRLVSAETSQKHQMCISSPATYLKSISYGVLFRKTVLASHNTLFCDEREEGAVFVAMFLLENGVGYKSWVPECVVKWFWRSI
jgi:hypothetical protein